MLIDWLIAAFCSLIFWYNDLITVHLTAVQAVRIISRGTFFSLNKVISTHISISWPFIIYSARRHASIMFSLPLIITK